MLILSRMADEAILIGDDITVTIVEIRGDKVRFGIHAPKRLAVHRREVFERILDGEVEEERLLQVTDEIGHLVLSRKLEQSIVFGDDGSISVTLNRIKGSRVSVAIDAPQEVRVRRAELEDDSDPYTEAV